MSCHFARHEMSKTSGYPLVDRRQRTPSQPPTLDGFIPRACRGQRVASPRQQTSLGVRSHHLLVAVVDGVRQRPRHDLAHHAEHELR
jgi:hypothetical protein